VPEREQPSSRPAPATWRVLHNNGGTVILNGVTIRYGRCNGSCVGISWSGGGIYNQSGTLTLDSSTVSANVASSTGAGIFNRATLNIQNGSLIGGAGARNSAFSGGGVSNVSGTTTIDNSTVSANVVGDDGAGIYITGGTLNVQNGSTIGGAGVPNNSGRGGGIFIQGSTANIDASGGGCIDTTAGFGTTITGSTFSSNTSSSHGGCIFNSGTLSITNSTFSNNSTGGFLDSGGGIYNDGAGTLRVTNSTFSGNSAGDASGAGGLHNTRMLHLRNTILANSGTGYDCLNTGTVAIDVSNLIENNAPVGTECGSPAFASDSDLAGLANNGGLTDTFFPAWDSEVVDNGDSDTCEAAVGSPSYGAGNLDQRGVTRPPDECDIGAVERDPEGPQVVDTSLVASYVRSGPSTFNVNLDNAGGGTDPDDAENPANYLLVEEGTLADFQTTACDTTDLINDSPIKVDSVSYNGSNYTSTLNINGGTPLLLGSYRLFVCGTTSIQDPVGNTLGGGDFDDIFDFVVVGPVAGALPPLASQWDASQICPHNLLPKPTAPPSDA